MNKRDDLTKLCDELEQCTNKLCYKNEIVCAKKKVKQYVGEDRNKLLKLRALVKSHDENDRTGFFSYLSTIVSTSSLCLVVLYNLTPQNAVGIKDLWIYNVYAISVLALILLYTCISFCSYKEDRIRRNWRKYIDVVLEELMK